MGVAVVFSCSSPDRKKPEKTGQKRGQKGGPQIPQVAKNDKKCHFFDIFGGPGPPKITVFDPFFDRF